MSWKRLTLTEDHLALIENIRFEHFEFDGTDETYDSANSIKRFGWGVDQYSLWGGTYAMEDIAMILGKYDQFIEGTEEEPTGRRYPEELENYWWELYDYIWSNLDYIISLVLWSVRNGGLSAGTYKCRAEDKIWKRVEENNK